jgi:hypothetical protein
MHAVTNRDCCAMPAAALLMLLLPNRDLKNFLKRKLGSIKKTVRKG